MKYRVIGAALFGLGVLFIVLAVGLRTYVGPAVSKLPYDLKRSTSVAEATGATFLEVRNQALVVTKNEDLRSVTDVVPQPTLTNELQGDLAGTAMVWDVYSTVSRIDDGAKVSEYSTELALDRVSGEAVQWPGAWLDEGAAGPDKTKLIYKGLVYKFPFGTEKKTYDFWDSKIRGTAPAQFVREESVKDLAAYRFEQRVERTEIPKPAAGTLKALLAAVAPGATDAQMFYSTTRILWVEPTTGVILNRLEQPRQELVTDNGLTVTLLSADFEYTEDTVQKNVKSAGDNKTKLMMITLYGPIGLGVLGLLLIIAGFAVQRRADRNTRSGGAHQYDDTLAYA